MKSDWFFKTLVAAAFTVIFGLSAWAGKTAIEDGNRITRLETQRNEIADRLERIEDKIDDLLLRSRRP